MARKTIHTPLGSLLLTEEEGFLAGLDWCCHHYNGSSAVLEKAADEINAYLRQDLKKFSVPTKFSDATPYQKRVWQTISEIPYGKTATYKEIAQELKSSPRAVGQACGKNPLPLIVPCHRVVGTKRHLGGYSGGEGVQTKQTLLAFERQPVRRIPTFSLWQLMRQSIPEKPFYFMRHGETDMNKKGMLQGAFINASLNENGRRQAAHAGQALAEIFTPDMMVWHSTLKRTEQTAHGLIEQLRCSPGRICSHPGLNERSFGVFDGSPTSEAPPHYNIYPSSPEGERWPQVIARLAESLSYILKHSSTPPLVISHGAVGRCLGELFGCWPAETHLNNCEIWYINPVKENQPWQGERLHAGGL